MDNSFVVFAGVFGLLLVLGALNFRRRGSSTSGSQGSKTTDVSDREFDEKDKHLSNFLGLQEHFLRACGGGRLVFRDDHERLKYIHFVMGAIDQLSRSIKDEKRRDTWQLIQSLAKTGIVYGADDMSHIVSGYGNSGSGYHECGARGWGAMRTYILGANQQLTDEEFKKSCMALADVVRNLVTSDEQLGFPVSQNSGYK